MIADISKFDWNKHLKECLESTTYCAIATVDPKGVWVNPVYFAYDNKLNLYFISQMPSRHMQNLKKNSRIAATIYKTEQRDDVCGTYLEGNAEIILNNKEKIKEAYDVYYGRAGEGDDMKNYIENPTWIFVKVTPENVYYFDTRFFDEERVEVPMEKINL